MIKVSVIMITYNHDQYIKQAIESILVQEVDFQIEIIIADDCSPDNTAVVIEKIIKSHSRGHQINYTRHLVNKGMQPNFVWAYRQCKGEFIAICEGDDYWIDPCKLQKQVDFLETNAEFIIHGGAAKLLKDKVVTEELIGYENRDKEFRINDFYSQNNLVTCTVVFRNCIKNFPEEYQKVVFGDWFLYVHLLNKEKAKAYRSTEVFSVYRIHNNGLMNSLSNLRNVAIHIRQIIVIHNYLKIGFSPKVKNILDKYFLKKYRMEIAEKQFYEASKTFIHHLKHRNIYVPFRKYLSEIKTNFKL